MENSNHLVLWTTGVLVICALTGFQANAQNSMFQITADRTVELVIIDPSGRLTGFDPTRSIQYDQIPGAYYDYESTGSTIDTTYDDTHDEYGTSADTPPTNGSYTVRIIGIKAGTYQLGFSGYRDTTTFGLGTAPLPISPGKISYCVMAYNNDPAIPITFAMQAPTRQVAGGIFNPEGTQIISVHSRTNTQFTGVTLETGVVTLKWPASSGATLGAVTSNYGYGMWDTLIVSGGYNYQKIRSTSGTSISKWIPNTDYQLFSIPVSGTNGPVTIELTNAIPGGEWYVDINYSDKSDTTFYRQSANVPLPNQGGQKPIK